MRFRLWAAMAACLFFLGGCDTINGFFTYGTATPAIIPTNTGPAPTPTRNPNATLAPGEYRVISGDSCLLATYPSLRADATQTNLIAWKPTSDALAIVAPLSDQLWYSGTLTVASGNKFAILKTLTKDIQVIGDVIWSPDGSRVAFVAYRQADTVYTVMVAQEDGKATDLFPDHAAVTDSYASPKTILQWANNDRLQVGVSCDVDCEKQVDINILDGTVTTADQSVHSGTLIPGAVATNQRAYKAADFPVMIDPEWSPDGNLVAYLDESGNPWVLSVKAHTQFTLNVSGVTVFEMKWSPDGKMIAVRTDGEVKIFSLACGN